MTAQALLSELRGLGVELAIEGDRLTVDAPSGAITEDLRAALVENKPRLIKLLTWEKRKLKRPTGAVWLSGDRGSQATSLCTTR